MTRPAAVVLLAAVLVAGCGGAKQPQADPGVFATKVVDLIVHNKYSDAWTDLHPVDQQVAPSTEYVGCENRNPVIAVPRRSACSSCPVSRWTGGAAPGPSGGRR